MKRKGLAHKYLNKVLDALKNIDYENPWYIVRDLLLVTIFTITSVLCISLPISPTNDSTSGENTFGSRKPPGKKRRVKKESDWKKYYGSCPELKEDIERLGRQNFSRTILSLHKTLGKTNYEETRQLFIKRSPHRIP